MFLGFDVENDFLLCNSAILNYILVYETLHKKLTPYHTYLTFDNYQLMLYKDLKDTQHNPFYLSLPKLTLNF